MTQRVSDRPNVVLCLTDQLRPFEIGCYGSRVVRTPDIDRLAADGVRFEIACTNNPCCTPARSILLAGQYSRTCVKTFENAEEPVPTRDRMRDPTLAEVFKKAGYRTGLIGKWHIHPQPELLGFDTVFYPYYNHRYTGQTYFRNDRKSEVVEGFNTDAELAEVQKWLREHKGDPFFLFYNISQPHMPVWDAPERFRDLYSPDEVVMRDNVWLDGKMAYDEDWFRIYLYDYLYYKKHLPYTEHMPDGFDLKHLTALYCGMVAWTDYQVGELMRSLEENSLAENTIVVFTSDHGDMLGSHHMFNKSSPLEESLRVPMIVHWPAGLRSGVVESQVSSLVDVMPTLLTLAGLETPAGVQGTDLCPVLRGEAECVGENAVFAETHHTSAAAIRTLTHLYGFRKDQAGGRQVRFYDVTQDPMEQRNLAGSPEHAALEQKMLERVERWDKKTPWLDVSAHQAR